MVVRSNLILAVLRTGVLLAAIAVSGRAAAVTISVGSSGCSFTSLQEALDHLEGEVGPHVVKLRTQTIAIPNGVVLDTSNTHYSFIGGHAQCNDANPTPGQRSTLDASGGNDGTAFAINGTSSSETPFISFARVTVRGGSSESGPFANPEGGGLEIRGRVSVVLADQTNIQNNRSGKGGGVFMHGDNANERAELSLIGESWIIANVATGDGGGGIYCAQHGRVFHNNGQVSFNDAAGEGSVFGSGGGALMRDTCRYVAAVEPGSYTGFFDNTSESAGAGLRKISQEPLNLRGAANAPFWFIGNRAGGGDAGGLGYDYTGTTRVEARLENVVFKNNYADSRMGAAFNIGGPVDVYFGPRVGATVCGFSGVPYGACAAVVGSRAGTVSTFGGSVHLNGSPGSVPALSVRRAVFVDNQGQNLFSTWGPGRFDIEGSIIQGNHLLARFVDPGAPDALISVLYDRFDPVPPTGLNQRLAYSTVIGNTSAGSVPVIFSVGGVALDVTGSILHNPSMGFRDVTSTGAVTHNGCLLVSSAAGVPTVPAPPIVGEPGLAADLTPNSASPVLDQCASVGAPLTDIRGNARAVDQPAAANRFGPVDLGAVERPLDPPPAAPNLEMSRSSIVVPDGSTTPFISGITDYGNVNVGQSLNHLFLVRNIGDELLTFTAHSVSGVCANNFRVAAVPGDRPPGTSGILGIIFEPIVAGECIATYQLFSNDPDNSPYDFQVRGVGTSAGSGLFADGFE